MIAPGQQILHYRILEKLGEGGMGVVWSATDTTLGRPVAIKVLPPIFSADRERLARFEREARVLASLNHPNIATVHSVHEVDGDRLLTMELVVGEDLAQRIARGPLPVPEALEIARQMALALEAAHESGIVHRDLKPANVRITPDGRVKVLDFGLAKALEAGAPTSALSQSPTLAGSVMGSGALIGTAAYMSPEQARGQAADRRSDIWGFGVVLYEMLSGRRAFEGDTVSDTLASVLKTDPDWAALPAGLSPRLRTLLERCLERNHRRRLRDIGEALLTIEDLIAGAPEPGPAALPARPRAGGRERLIWAGAIAVVAVVATLVGLSLRPSTQPPLRKYTLALKDVSGTVSNVAISPDGRMLAYVVSHELWVRDLSQLTSRKLADGLDDDFRPLWSPDGDFIVFAAGNTLSRVGVSSGASSPLCSVGGFSGGSGGTWASDGRLLFTKGEDHIYSVPAGGGVPSVFHACEDSVDGDLHHPFALPGGRGVLYVRHLLAGGASVLALTENGSRRDLLRLESGVIWQPVYDPRGYVIFTRVGEGAGLWALPFSVARMQVTGEPFLIEPDGGSPSVSANGDLAYTMASSINESQVVRVDPSGAVVETLSEPQRGMWSIALSPDENLLAVEIREATDTDVWLYDLGRKAQTRFAFGDGRQGEPAWSPDGKALAWNEFGQDLYLAKPVDGSQAPWLLARGYMGQFTPDGRHVVYVRNSAGTGSDIWYRSLDAPNDTVAVVATPADESLPMLSPGGDYLLYVSDESGRREIYLRQFPTGQGRWQVSTNGGERAVWSRKGDRIYYYWAGEKIFEVPVTLRPGVRLGSPRELFDPATVGLQTWGRYTVLPTSNPDRFVTLKPTSTTSERHTDVVLVQNWSQEFARK